MFTFIRKFMSRRASPPAAGRRHPARCRLECEPLEDRVLLSLVGPEFQANTKTKYDQNQPAVARSANGQSVVVWTDRVSATNTDIKARVYNSALHKWEPELTVAATTKNEFEPAVAMDGQGHFVVVWTVDALGSNGLDVKAQRFSGTGAKMGSVMTIQSGVVDDHDASVAWTPEGSFVVSYTRDVSPTDKDIKAQKFAPDGSFQMSYLVARTSMIEQHSSVAISDRGFAIAWEKKDPSSIGGDIQVRVYPTQSSLPAALYTLDSSPRPDLNPSVAMDNNGNVVVAYQALVGSSFDIKAMRLSNTGVLSSEYTIAATADDEFDPVVAMHPTSGSFVVAYTSQDQTVLNAPQYLNITEVDTLGMPTSHFNLGDKRWSPAISIDTTRGLYLVAYVGSSPMVKATDVDGNGVFAEFGWLT